VYNFSEVKRAMCERRKGSRCSEETKKVYLTYRLQTSHHWTEDCSDNECYYESETDTVSVELPESEADLVMSKNIVELQEYTEKVEEIIEDRLPDCDGSGYCYPSLESILHGIDCHDHVITILKAELKEMPQMAEALVKVEATIHGSEGKYHAINERQVFHAKSVILKAAQASQDELTKYNRIFPLYTGDRILSVEMVDENVEFCPFINL